MSSKSYVSGANQDWSKFDFTRWNLDGLNLDNQTASLASWVREVTLSPQGQQKFAEGLVTVKSAVLSDLKDRVNTLQNSLKSADSERTARVANAQARIAEFNKTVCAASVPAVVEPDSQSFRISTKLLDEGTRLGLPGLHVRVFDTRSPKVTLATTTTDLTGNAILELNSDQTLSLQKDNGELAMEVLTPENKPIVSGTPVPAAKLNQTGTVVLPLKASADLQAHVDAATAAMADQQAQLKAMTAKVDSLHAHYQQIKDDLQQELQETQQNIADLQKD